MASTKAAKGQRGPRLSAQARRSSILKAARKAFGDTGDVNGTTMRRIADEAGISEGVIYRHFESKDQLFYEAVVEPLREAIDALVAAAEEVDRDQPFTSQRQVETVQGLYAQLTSTFEKILPLLGLVLFGEPKTARRFFRDHFLVAMDRLAEAWAEFERRYGADVTLAHSSVRAVMGSALVLALESSYSKDGFDRARHFEEMARGMTDGFFPDFEGA